MIQVLGLPCGEAVQLLQQEGFRVETRLVRCRKDSEGDREQIVRQAVSCDGTVILSYAVFRSEPAEQ